MLQKIFIDGVFHFHSLCVTYMVIGIIIIKHVNVFLFKPVPQINQLLLMFFCVC